jgi:hypothetical protein
VVDAEVQILAVFHGAPLAGRVGVSCHTPAMIALRNATCPAKASRPGALALTVVRGRRATKALLTST